MSKRKRGKAIEQEDDGHYSPTSPSYAPTSPSYVPPNLDNDYSPTSPAAIVPVEEGVEEGHEEGHEEEMEAHGQEERLQFPLCTDPDLHSLNREIDEQTLKIDFIKLEVDTLQETGYPSDQEINVRKRIFDINRLERILSQTVARREELLKRKIDGLLKAWDDVFDTYTCPLEDNWKKPSRRPVANCNLRKHGDKVYQSVYALGCSAGHWGTGEPGEGGPKYTGCDCYLYTYIY